MGYLTLSNLRTDVDAAMGDKDISNGTLERWINFGLLDLAGSVLFDEDITTSSINTVGSTENITFPAGAMSVLVLRDTTSDNILTWLPLAEFQRRTKGTEGAPTHWTRIGANIMLNPIPDGVYALYCVFRDPPTLYSGASDVSPYPDIWDPAIFMFSVYHGMLATGDEVRASAWLARAINFVQSRITAEDINNVGLGLGASLPQGVDRLMKRIEGGE